MASIPMRMRTAPHQGRVKTPSPVTPLRELLTPVQMVQTMLGTRETMPAKRMMEMPLPMPNSVICSPSHMTKAEPAVKDTMMTMPAQMPFMPAGVDACRWRSDQGVVAEALEQGDGHGGVAGDGGELLPALLAALLLEALQSGDGDGEELDDDGAVDIGLHAQGEDRGGGEGAAAHGVHHAQDGAAHVVEVLPQQVRGHEGHRDRRAQPEDEQGEDGEEDLLAQLRDLPGILDGLDHVRPPRTFHLPRRSSPWRRRRRRWPGRSASSRGCRCPGPSRRARTWRGCPSPEGR